MNEAEQAWIACKRWAKGPDLSWRWTRRSLLDYHHLRLSLASPGSCEATPQPPLLTPATPPRLVPGSHSLYLLSSCTICPLARPTPIIVNTSHAYPYDMKGCQPLCWFLISRLISHIYPFLLSPSVLLPKSKSDHVSEESKKLSVIPQSRQES